MDLLLKFNYRYLSNNYTQSTRENTNRKINLVAFITCFTNFVFLLRLLTHKPLILGLISGIFILQIILVLVRLRLPSKSWIFYHFHMISYLAYFHIGFESFPQLFDVTT